MDSGGDMPHRRKSGSAAALLHKIGLRATDQRIALLALLFEAGDRHVTSEGLFREACAAGIPVVRATVYNTLHALAEHGLLRRIVIDAERTYFDTNVTHSCHLYCENTGQLLHMSEATPALQALLDQLGGIAPDRVDVLIRLKAEPGTAAPPTAE